MNETPPTLLNNAKSLLSKVDKTLAHNEELRQLKGENFNLFSILKMESKENATHSAFLGELLNPKGSHNMGGVFLERWMEMLQLKKIKTAFTKESATLKLEQYVGVRNDTTKTGGRIDIYLKDNKHNTISIENKIYASDQYAQIERYVNHNKGTNTVLYLTLYGAKPSKESAGELKNEKDYYCISYKDDVKQWLEACMKDAVDYPVIRESVKQYIILINKLTNQLTDQKMSKELEQLVATNYESARMIAGAIAGAEKSIALTFVKELYTEIAVQLNGAIDKPESECFWEVNLSKKLGERYKGISFRHKSWKPDIKVKIEAESEILKDRTYYGLIALKSNYDREEINSRLSKIMTLEDWSKSDSWPCYRDLYDMSSPEFKGEILKPERRAELITEYASIVVDFGREINETFKGSEFVSDVVESEDCKMGIIGYSHSEVKE